MSHKLKADELDILKNGLGFAIKPPQLNSSDILTTFEWIHYSMKEKLKNQEHHTYLKNEFVHVAQSYISSYCLTPADLKQYNILRNISKNKDIIVLRPDKGNGVIIMDRQVYKNSCNIIISDQSKFKRLDKDPTLFREAKLQRLLRKLKNQGCLDDNTYYNIFPKGSQPARFYGLPKLHKQREPNSAPPLRPIVSSINAYNYKLAKYLCSILSTLIPDKHTTKDSFCFVEKITNLDLDQFDV